MDRRTVLRRGAALGVASFAAGCLESSASTEGDWDVGMTATAFEPRTVSIEPDDTVVWYNNSSKVHTVSAYEGSLPTDAAYFSTGGFESEDAARQAFANGAGHLRPDEAFSHTFEVPGRYDYFCIPHERANMVGAVDVGDVDGSSE
ncbi:MAG: plastocyanin/azurin family copper-binding protein [Haloarculaceae archaeon]